MALIEDRYLDGSYLAANPEWDRSDARWKAAQVLAILRSNQLSPHSFCDIGCGSGDALACLQADFPESRFVGFDISPQLEGFWRQSPSIAFHLGNFHEINNEVFDLLMMLDVFEHVRDPFTFLDQSRRHARSFVFHIPLDLSALSVARGSPLMRVRRGVGHLHFYTRDLALETLTECGYTIDEWRYTGAFKTLATHHSWKTRMAALPRRVAYAINKDAGVRIFGGETLIVLAH
jgi:SAM-dependent methyltransferase